MMKLLFVLNTLILSASLSAAEFHFDWSEEITQKWIGLFPDGWEAFAEVRRTGYPKLYPLIAVENPNLGVNDIFRRMTFVESEYSNNAAATQAAEGLLNGANNNATKVWWDKK